MQATAAAQKLTKHRNRRSQEAGVAKKRTATKASAHTKQLTKPNLQPPTQTAPDRAEPGLW